MDRQSYLNEISTNVRPTQAPKWGWLTSKYFILGVAAVGLLIVFAIIGNVLNGNKSNTKEQTIALGQRLENIAEVISDYQPSVKSSDLRSSSASLYGVVSNTNNGINSYVEGVMKSNEISNLKKESKDSEDAHAEELSQELFEAKINGVLDRIYAHKMAYEISLIMAMENKLYDATKDESLKSILNTSYISLENIYDKFDGFSEAN